MALEQLFVKMHAVIAAIPRGRVATYGQVAELAGCPGGARVAAASLKAAHHGLPWQRVVGKAGKLRGRIKILDPVGAAMQRQLLEAEGVTVGDAGIIKLDVYGWLPELSTALPRRSTAKAARKASSGRARTARGPRPRAAGMSSSRTRRA